MSNHVWGVVNDILKSINCSTENSHDGTDGKECIYKDTLFRMKLTADEKKLQIDAIIENQSWLSFSKIKDDQDSASDPFCFHIRYELDEDDSICKASVWDEIQTSELEDKLIPKIEEICKNVKNVKTHQVKANENG